MIATMPRVALVHWNASEAKPRLAQLRAAGYRTEHAPVDGADAVRALRARPPDAVVIDLTRLPAHGREVAGALRRAKVTRSLPIVFAGGEPQKVARARELLPDAVYTDWPQIANAVAKAMRSVPAAPVVPSTMDAYSSAPLPKKFGIKPGMRVAVSGAPETFERTLGPLPETAVVAAGARAGADLVLLFAKSQGELEHRFAAAESAVEACGRFWVIYPKKASKVASDLDQAAVRAFGMGLGWVDYKVCAVDATWTGLAFARKRG